MWDKRFPDRLKDRKDGEIRKSTNKRVGDYLQFT